ncbi:MAG TPA: hypothetical protein PKD91_15305, partial [Bacteroidia bacterium]|nr:hypothetical protein [Bacteroidia bacterium]
MSGEGQNFLELQSHHGQSEMGHAEFELLINEFNKEQTACTVTSSIDELGEQCVEPGDSGDEVCEPAEKQV